MAFETAAITNYLLGLAEADCVAVSPMKLQKLLYYAHGWHLALTDAPLLDEAVQAWQYGPVIQSVYHEFKKYGASSIPSGVRMETGEFTDTGFKLRIPELDQSSPQTADARAIIFKVWNVYKGFGASQLSTMTHQPGSPWAETYEGSTAKRGLSIPDEKIKKHFKNLKDKRK